MCAAWRVHAAPQGRNVVCADQRRIVTPLGAFVIHHGRDIGIIENRAERRHRRGIVHAVDHLAGQPVQDGVDVIAGIGVQHGRIAFQRREDTGQSGAIALMAGAAVVAIHPFAARRPDGIRRGRCGRCRRRLRRARAIRRRGPGGIGHIDAIVEFLREIPGAPGEHREHEQPCPGWNRRRRFNAHRFELIANAR